MLLTVVALPWWPALLPLLAYPHGPVAHGPGSPSWPLPLVALVRLPCAVSWWHTTADAETWPRRWCWWGRDGFDHGDGGKDTATGSRDGNGQPNTLAPLTRPGRRGTDHTTGTATTMGPGRRRFR